MIFYKESPTNINLKLYNTRVSNPDVVQHGPINWSITTLRCIFLFTAATPLSVGIFDVIGVQNELHLGTDFIQPFLLLFPQVIFQVIVQLQEIFAVSVHFPRSLMRCLWG
jgi:hypothetical protein